MENHTRQHERTPFAWQLPLWEKIIARKNQNNLPHALLFLGEQGVGKKHFSEVLANTILCQHAVSNYGCQQCKSCTLFSAGTHPDFKAITPEEGSQVIKIDQVREVVQFVNATPLLGGYRLILIHPADALNTAAANALLKTLEEPTANTLIILISQQVGKLPATILSRCQRYTVPKPHHKIALGWLKANYSEQADTDLNALLHYADGAPLTAQYYLEIDYLNLRKDILESLKDLRLKKADPVKLAERWSDKSKAFQYEETLCIFLAFLHDLLRVKISVAAPLTYQDYQPFYDSLANSILATELIRLIDSVQQTYARIMGAHSLNKTLALEELLIQWMLLCT